MAANPHRGEVKIELEGQTLLMRPTFACLVEIEQGSGKPIMELVRRFADRRFGFADVTAVVAAGLKAAGAPVTNERVAEMVFNTGLLESAVPATRLLAATLKADVADDDLAGERESAPGENAGEEPGKSGAAEG